PLAVPPTSFPDRLTFGGHLHTKAVSRMEYHMILEIDSRSYIEGVSVDVRAALSGNEEIARCRRLFEPALRAAVSRLHPWSARMAAFSLGWTDTDGRPYPGNAGKGVRPAVALLTAEGAGAPAESAVPAAVAVELVHAFSLIHDDIIDH